jgi:hypothetical protein
LKKDVTAEFRSARRAMFFCYGLAQMAIVRGNAGV